MKIKIILFVALILAVNVGVFAQKAKINTEPLQIGAIAPDFTLDNSNGEGKITLSKVKKPTVLVFYRGYW
jgi:cytochrome oxidase Cu insertion factor (SCO1/SenC/PrrC family)